MTLQNWEHPRELVQHDWDFSGCQDAELRFCLYYEYCRESKARDVVKLIRDRQATVPVGFLCLILDWLAQILNHFATFPESPWLDLPEKERTKYLDNRDSFAKIINETASGLNIVMVAELEKYAGHSWRPYHLPQHPDSASSPLFPKRNSRHGWLEISEGFSKIEIINQFKLYLDRISKDDAKFFLAKSGGRGGPSDQLKQLGVYRVMCGRSAQAAFNYTSQTCPRLYYMDGDGKGNKWYKARDAAAKQIKQFDEVACSWLEYLKAIK